MKTRKYVKAFESFIGSDGNLNELSDITLDEVPVKVIDMDKLNTDIDNEIRDKIVETDTKLRTSSGRFGLIEIPNEDTDSIALVDQELVGNFMKDGSITLPIYEDSYEDGKRRGIGMMPKYQISMSLSELKDYVSHETSLKEFMDKRYKYNPRIENNMMGIAKRLGVKYI